MFKLWLVMNDNVGQNIGALIYDWSYKETQVNGWTHKWTIGKIKLSMYLSIFILSLILCDLCWVKRIGSEHRHSINFEMMGFSLHVFHQRVFCFYLKIFLYHWLKWISYHQLINLSSSIRSVIEVRLHKIQIWDTLYTATKE